MAKAFNIAIGIARGHWSRIIFFGLPLIPVQLLWNLFLSLALTGHIFGGPLPGVDTRNRIVPGSWENLQQDFAKHPPAYIIDLYSRPGALYPVQQFPILAKLLAEHYQPVARTEDGVIYCRSDYRALAHHDPKSNR